MVTFSRGHKSKAVYISGTEKVRGQIMEEEQRVSSNMDFDEEERVGREVIEG